MPTFSITGQENKFIFAKQTRQAIIDSTLMLFVEYYLHGILAKI
jgi:hypothetical protein